MSAKRVSFRIAYNRVGIASSKGHVVPVVAHLIGTRIKRIIRPLTGAYPIRKALEPAVLPVNDLGLHGTKPEVLEELHRILRSVAHDLRTPLATIMNCVEILDLRSKNEGQHVLEQMRRSAERMSELISSMLERARESAEIPNIKWIDMPMLLDRVRNEVEQSQPPGSAFGRIRLLNAPWVHGNPVKVAQVFTNLLSNAVKYSRKAVQPLINVEGQVKDNEIVYTISDNGIGIGPDNLEDLFKPFQRLNNALDIEGNGVGLTIVKEIMEGMKGRVWVTSTPGVQTRFHLAFPKGSPATSHL